MCPGQLSDRTFARLIGRTPVRTTRSSDPSSSVSAGDRPYQPGRCHSRLGGGIHRSHRRRERGIALAVEARCQPPTGRRIHRRIGRRIHERPRSDRSGQPIHAVIRHPTWSSATPDSKGISYLWPLLAVGCGSAEKPFSTRYRRSGAENLNRVSGEGRLAASVDSLPLSRKF